MKRCFIQLLLLIVATYTFASSSIYTCTGFSIEQGLQDRRTFSCAKGIKGYLWVATRTSIDRYDGERFMHYTLPFKKENERIKGVVSSEDKLLLYAFSNHYIYKYNDHSDQFEIIDVAISPNTENRTIRGVVLDASNSIFAFTNEGLYNFDPKGKKWNQLLNKSIDKSVYDAIFDKKGNLWIGTGRGITQLSKKNGIWTVSCPIILKDQRIQCLYFEPYTENLWVGTFSSGLYIYSTIKKSIEHKNQYQVKVPIRRITSISDRSIWLATDGLGILEYELKSGNFIQRLGSSPLTDLKFTPNNIYYILNDGPIVWINTYSNGLFAIRTQNVLDQIYRVNPTHNGNSPQNHINSILEDRDQNLWFATNEGIYFFNSANRQLQTVYNKKDESGVYLTLFQDANDNIWAGGYSTRTLRINSRTKAVSAVELIPNRKDYYIYTIEEDGRGNIWFGSAVDSLICYSPDQSKGSYHAPQGAYSLSKYTSDSILVGGVNGLYVAHAKSREARMINLRNTPIQRNPFIYNLMQTDENESTYWFTTDGQGLCRLNLQTMEFQSWGTESGLSSNYLYGILSDQGGRLWISSENGLNCFNPKTKEVITLMESIGLPNRIFNFSAFTKRKNGNMVWGTPSEAIEIDPFNPILKGKRASNLRFVGFYLSNNLITPGSENSPLRESIDKTEKIRLSSSQNSFAIEFANLNQMYGDMVIYRWRLKGVDDNWITSSYEHRAAYNNISPGSYELTVQTLMQGSNEVLQERTIDIRIRPPFWASWFAIILYILTIGSVLYFVYRYYQKLYEARSSDEKIRFFINLAHDIRTPITLIKAPLNELEHEQLSSDGKNALNLALSNTEKLFNRVTQLLDFQKIERKAMVLQVEKVQANQFLFGVCEHFQLIAKRKNITLTINLLSEDQPIWLDQDKISLIIENLVTNAIKYTNPMGHVGINASIRDKRLQIEVFDDGIGIPQSAQRKIFSRFYRAENATNSKETGSGIGLLLVQRLVTLHKGNINFISNEGKGTIFTVRIPCYESEYSNQEKYISGPYPIQHTNAEVDGNFEYSILIVEDNEELRSYLSSYLSKKYNVFEAENGLKGIEKAKNNNIDLIISDVMMPEMNGFEMCQQLKSDVETSHIPIILLTSLSERQEVIKGIELGAEDFVTKPFDLILLETKIHNFITKRIERKENYIQKSPEESEESFNQVSETDRKFLLKLHSLMEENMSDEEYSIEKMACDLAMSHTVFYKKVKVLLGITPKELVIDLKMKKAGELLRSQKHNISEVAYLVGFQNSKYFSTAFKKYYGQTPSQYIEQKNTTNKNELST